MGVYAPTGGCPEVGDDLTFANDKVDASGSLVTIDPRKSSTSSTPAQTATSAASATVLTSNVNRKGLILQNTGTVAVKFTLGGTNPTQSVYHFCLAPCSSADDGTGATYVDDQWTGDVRAISVSAGTIVVTELT